MNFIEIILIALSLSVDSFAVSVGGGISMGKARPGKALGIASVFGMMQAGLLAAGCLFGVWIESYIGCFSGYLGFFLLLLIGGSMVMSFSKGK